MNIQAYYERKKKLRTVTTKPTMTDQSMAKDTDLNVIVGKFLKGQLPNGAAQKPMYGDFTQYPPDLKGFIDISRDLYRYRQQLPGELRDMKVEELMGLTNEQLTAILTPPAPTPADEEKSK